MIQLTKEQIEFLDVVVSGTWKLNSNGEVDVKGWVGMQGMNLTEIPVKFGSVWGDFNCSKNHLTTLKNAPKSIVGGRFYCSNNQLTNYFKNIKEEDFPHWDKLYWGFIIEDYPFLINIGKKYMTKDYLEEYLERFPLTKIYLE